MSDPSPDRYGLQTLRTRLSRDGIAALRTRRGGTSAEGAARRRKFTMERLVGRYLANPSVAFLDRMGVRTSLLGELETTGRRTGRPRRVPVGISVDPAGAWVVSQHGRHAGWAHNVGADAAVRVRIGRTWRSGRAVFVPEDDVAARTRSFAPGRWRGALVVASFKALQTDPISVRITFDPAPAAGS